MPKLVDADERRDAVVDAVLRVAEREGIGQASLRTVAAEAGLNVGSVRHYFAGHRELLRFAMRSVIDRTSARLVRHREATRSAALTPEERLEARTAVVAELLPIDGTRRRENAVLLEFVVAARTDPDLADLAEEVAAGVASLARIVVEAVGVTGVTDVETETQRLAALIDGLGQRCVLHPGLLDPAAAVAVLRAHLASLAPMSPGPEGGQYR